ncbi:MAG TPA: hypothetical protein ENF77_04390 [Candidatus Acetothermia bacterium]|nr:hypothetical protein [Candidatus Acetothermia bacterium]
MDIMDRELEQSSLRRLGEPPLPGLSPRSDPESDPPQDVGQGHGGTGKVRIVEIPLFEDL